MVRKAWQFAAMPFILILVLAFFDKYSKNHHFIHPFSQEGEHPVVTG